MRAFHLSLLSLCCLLLLTGCGAALAGQVVIETATGTPTAPAASTADVSPTSTVAPAPNTSWQKLWTLPALPPPPAGTYGADPPYLPQIAWSPANAQRLYLCRASSNYSGMPALLHDLYRSDDQGQHWKAYALPEAAASCYLEVDPTNADALVLQDNLAHSYVSRDGGQSWQAVPNPPQWDSSLGEPPNIQLMAGKLYVEGYWTTDLTHWTRWYPVAGEQQPVYVQINPQRPATLYTSVEFSEFRCAGSPTVSQVNGSPLVHLAQLCRSDDGGQTWRFLAVVAVENSSNDLSVWNQANYPDVCLVLNHPEELYMLGYTVSGSAPLQPTGLGAPMRSTDGGNTWTSLPDTLVGGEVPNLACGAEAYAGQSPVRINSNDAAADGNVWQNFAITASGDIYHVVDTAGTRQGVTMSQGVSLLKGANWQVIAPYPTGLTTPDTNYKLRMLLIAPPSGALVLLGYTEQAVYAYPLAVS